MCRLAQLHFDLCGHIVRIDLTPWCNAKRRGQRADGSNCHSVHYLQFDRQCERCAVIKGRDFVNRIYGQLEELERMSTNQYPALLHMLDYGRHEAEVVSLAREHKVFVTTYNRDVPLLLDRYFARYTRQTHPDNGEGPARPRDHLRMKQLRYDDPDELMDIFGSRIRHAFTVLLEPGQGWAIEPNDRRPCLPFVTRSMYGRLDGDLIAPGTEGFVIEEDEAPGDDDSDTLSSSDAPNSDDSPDNTNKAPSPKFWQGPPVARSAPSSERGARSAGEHDGDEHDPEFSPDEDFDPDNENEEYEDDDDEIPRPSSGRRRRPRRQ
ncbi:MAG: hypothetical protein M1826_002465 [Phylliscum demangeonii]|nr:MAG: hypothetical protein M1826_002465 [Phylliscum demangeonii]